MRALLLSTLLFLVLAVQAQPPNDDCVTAANLCAQQPLTGNNTGATGWPGFCPSTANVLWYTFTTNSQGGSVNIDIGNITCPGVIGMDDELSVVVLNGDGSCLPGSFSAASSCQQSNTAFTATAGPLTPNTQYWVIVAGVANSGATIPAQCDFSIVVSGPGADIVNVDFDAGPDVTIAEGDDVQLNAVGGSTYLWTPNSGLSSDVVADPIAQPTENTNYTVTTQLNGCTYTDQVFVEVERLIDPVNAITPNGDGINETWEIAGIDQYPSCRVSIYDRWGQKVYSSTGYREPFNGTRNGSPLPVGTYYWYIDLQQLEGRSAPYTGHVSIIR
jgi:gliding motility-associated-like protein